MKIFSILIIVTLGFYPLLSIAKDKCTYETWDWNTVLKKSVNKRLVQKRRSQMTKEETGTVSGCSVCEEDQEEVKLTGLPAFKICRRFKEQILSAIQNAKSQNFPLFSIIGYRVGKSKGPIDRNGIRTEFSHHSFGTAIDFNSELNGLYDKCLTFNSFCRLIRGGSYVISKPGAITPQSALYKEMMKIGFQWGGEIKGQQKDFMHFSLTGD